jgi:U3 small nucleolar RNA-associated protein 13
VSNDRTLKRWNLPGAAELDAAATSGSELDLNTFCTKRAHEKDINIVAIAPNDSLIATGSQDKLVKLWKATDLSSVATLKGHRRGVWDITFSPFDRILATASGDKTIKLWSLSDFSCVRTFQGHVASVLRVRFLNGGLQLLSSGADGLVKLWTVRTNECEATMENHKDKVWALDLAPNGKQLVSGGADSQIIVFVDTTKEVDDAKRAEEEQAILVDQKLANHLRRKEYAEALDISLERDKPHQTLKVLNAIIDADLMKGWSGLTSLKKYALTWKNDRLVRILRYCREWNTRARNSHVALLTIKAVVTTVPASTLASISEIPEILAGLVPYAERHFERFDRLHASSYLFDFMLSSMGVIESNLDPTSDVASTWEPKLVLPPTKVDGRVDVGGNVVVGVAVDDEELGSEDEVVTIGDSDDSDDE